jgi:histidinol-phosphate aminotransferase
LALACAKPGATTFAPGFVMYEISAQLQGLEFIGVPLQADFALDGQAMLAAIAAHQPAIVYLAYPNNPTANLFDDAVVAQIVQACQTQDTLLVIDEAYQPFAARNYLERMAQQPHVLLMRTLSKFGLAGVRLGYLVGSSALIAQLNKVRPPYNISALNAEAALFALEHADTFAAQAALLRQERSRLMQALALLPGCQAYPSEANMILVRVHDAAQLFQSLLARQILVKNVSGHHPLLHNCLRLTIGAPLENDALITALKESLTP